MSTCCPQFRKIRDKLQQRDRELALFNQMGQMLRSAPSSGQVFDVVTEEICKALEVTASSIWLIDSQTGELVCRQAASPNRGVICGWRLAPGEGIAGWVAGNGQGVVVPDVLADERYCGTVDQRVGLGLRSLVCAPLTMGQDVLGVLEAVDTKIDRFNDRDLTLLSSLASLATVGIEYHRLLQRERRQRELTEALAAAAGAVNSTLELEQVLDCILEQVARVVSGDAHGVVLIEEDGVARMVRRHRYEQSMAAYPVVDWTVRVARYPKLEAMIRDGRPVIIRDAKTEIQGEVPDFLQWVRSCIGAPIQVGGNVIGFLCVAGACSNQFDPSDAQRLAIFADHAAAAIGNARLYHQVRDYSETLEGCVQVRTAQLQSQYTQLEAILSSTSDGIVVIGENGKVTRTNPVARKWLTEALSPEDAATLRAIMQDLARRAAQQPRQIVEVTGVDLELQAMPVVPASGADTWAVVVIHDVSHLKALDRMKSRFVSNVSHEFRTPVSTIQLYAQLMEHATPDLRKEYQEALLDEVSALARLVDDVLQISRADADRLDLAFDWIPVNAVAEKAVAAHQILAQQQELTLLYRPTELDPVATVDRDHLRQVLNNLVENAIHYTLANGQVVVSTDRVEAKGRVWATIAVADTGIGIPEEDLVHIFERFYRGERAQVSGIPGTGLGLAIVKEIVDLHGGWVTVHSEVDMGTTFTVHLPTTDA